MADSETPGQRFIDYRLPLRPGVDARLVLPNDFNEGDAVRLCEIVRSLALPAGASTEGSREP